MNDMITAFTVWQHRIAPVFDTADTVYLVESDGKRIIATTTEGLPGHEPEQKLAWLRARGVSLLVCGAVSRLVQAQAVAGGIAVIPFVAGDLEQVVQAWQDGSIRSTLFAMPGCCGRQHRRQGCRGRMHRPAETDFPTTAREPVPGVQDNSPAPDA